MTSFTRPKCHPAAGPDSHHMTSVTDVLSSWIFQVMMGVLPRMWRRKLQQEAGGFVCVGGGGG